MTNPSSHPASDSSFQASFLEDAFPLLMLSAYLLVVAVALEWIAFQRGFPAVGIAYLFSAKALAIHALFALIS